MIPMSNQQMGYTTLPQIGLIFLPCVDTLGSSITLKKNWLDPARYLVMNIF